MDNGPEFIAKIARQWSEANEIEFKYIEPGKPTPNAYIERFNKSYGEAVLDAKLFDSLEEVREVSQAWAKMRSLQQHQVSKKNLLGKQFSTFSKY